MPNTDPVRIPIRADTKRAIRGLDSVRRGLKTLTPTFGQMRFAALAATAALVGVGVAAISVIKQTAKAGDELQKMSLRTGLSAEALSELKHAAEISGSSIEDLEKGVKTLSKRISDARFGLQTYVRIFENLNVEYVDAQGNLRNVDDVMMESFEAISQLKSETEQMAMAQELFGKAGTKLIPLMKLGQDGIEELREEAHRLGITFTDFEADQAAEFNDAMLRMTGAAQGLGKTLAVDVIPKLTNFFDTLTGFLIENKAQIIATAKDWATSVGAMAEITLTSGAIVMDWVSNLSAGFREITIGSLQLQLSALQDQAKGNAQRLSLQHPVMIDNAKQRLEINRKLNELINKQVAWAKDPTALEQVKAITIAIRESLTSAAVETEEGEGPVTGVEAVENMMGWNDEDFNAWMAQRQQQLTREWDLNEFFRKRDEKETTRLANLKKARQQQLFDVLGKQTQGFYAMSEAFGGKFFEVYKAFAIGETIIDTYKAAQGAYAALAGIPIVGPALAAAAAAAAIGAGIARVASIKSQKPGGGGTVASTPTGGGGYAGTFPFESPLATPTEALITTEDRVVKETTINITVEGSLVDHAALAREMSPFLEEADEDKILNFNIVQRG